MSSDLLKDVAFFLFILSLLWIPGLLVTSQRYKVWLLAWGTVYEHHIAVNFCANGHGIIEEVYYAGIGPYIDPYGGPNRL